MNVSFFRCQIGNIDIARRHMHVYIDVCTYVFNGEQTVVVRVLRHLVGLRGCPAIPFGLAWHSIYVYMYILHTIYERGLYHDSV